MARKLIGILNRKCRLPGVLEGIDILLSMI